MKKCIYLGIIDIQLVYNLHRLIQKSSGNQLTGLQTPPKYQGMLLWCFWTKFRKMKNHVFQKFFMIFFFRFLCDLVIWDLHRLIQKSPGNQLAGLQTPPKCQGMLLWCFWTKFRKIKKSWFSTFFHDFSRFLCVFVILADVLIVIFLIPESTFCQIQSHYCIFWLVKHH